MLNEFRDFAHNEHGHIMVQTHMTWTVKDTLYTQQYTTLITLSTNGFIQFKEVHTAATFSTASSINLTLVTVYT